MSPSNQATPHTTEPRDSITGQAWYDSLGQVVDALGSEAFFDQLMAALNAQVPSQHPQVWLFRPDHLPTLIYDAIGSGDRKVQIDGYIAGAYQQDPFYQQSQQGSGLFRITEISAGSFEQNEYYSGYFSRMRVSDEVGYLYQLGEGATLNITLQRRLSEPRFSAQDLDFFRKIDPLTRALISRHWALYRGQLDSQDELEQSIERGIALFGSSTLTEREQQTLQLLLRGYGGQAAADKLGISIETLRRHRKHIYQKLDIGSQAELFSLFINSLPFLAQAPDSDPLVQYQLPPSSD